MRAVPFDPDKLADPAHKDWWTGFLERAQEATDTVVDEWEKWFEGRAAAPPGSEFDGKFQQAIWKDLKRWLLEHVFHVKCAYCESPLDLDRYLGDAEHYRPKGQVTVDGPNNVKVRVRVRLLDGTEIDHPGYFWLAYDWRNLMPACSPCNSGSAKVDRFPAGSACLMVKLDAAELAALIEKPIASKKVPGAYYLRPADLDAREQPLLLNPLNANGARVPEKHLRFGVGGIVVAVDGSPVGTQSIKVFQLEREALRARRQKAQEQAQRVYYAALQKPGVNFAERLREDLATYESGAEEYSAAALDYLDVITDMQRKALPVLRRRD